jgi:hypothetical protein
MMCNNKTHAVNAIATANSARVTAPLGAAGVGCCCLPMFDSKADFPADEHRNFHHRVG